MSMVDGGAAAALQKIISGNTTPWSGPERSAWTRFILSLLFRNPEAVDTTLKVTSLRCGKSGFMNLRSITQPGVSLATLDV